jgi:hypothetical protein
VSLQQRWVGLEGSWSGTKRVWVEPGAPVRESKSTATVSLIAQGRFMAIRYTWAEGGKPQDGILVIRLPEEPGGAIDAAWADSWHQSREIMHSGGEGSSEGVLSVLGHYAAPPGPDWGWRIELHPKAPDAWELLMYNITPDGQEALGVQASFARGA